MLKPSLALAAAMLLGASAAAAAELGSVTKVLRPQVRAFDDKGQPLGQIPGAEIKVPAPIVGFGVGNSVGLRHAGKVIYLRGLDVQTDKASARCAPVQGAARAKGAAYAASNMGLGGAADCQKEGQ